VICGAAIHIEEVIHIPQSGSVYYSGLIHFAGDKIPFLVAATELDAHPFRWLRSFLLSKDLGVLYYNPSWTKHVVPIALQFHQPRLVQGLDRYGWDDANHRWVFPSFWVGQQGETREHQTPQPKARYVNIADPPRPQVLSRQDIETLQAEGPATSIAWALAAEIVHNLMSVPFSYETAGIGLVGPGAAAALELGMALGCPTKQLQSLSGNDARFSDRIHDSEMAVGWPLVLTGYRRGNQGWATWLSVQPHNCLIVINRLDSNVGLINGGWHRVEVEPFEQATTEVRDSLTRVLPRFLQYMMERGMKWPPGLAPLAAAFDLLETWFVSEGGQAGIVSQGAGLATGSYQGVSADEFAALLFQLMTEGVAQIEHVGYSEIKMGRRRRKLALTFSPKEKGYLVPQIELNMLLENRNLPALNAATVGRGLVAADALLRETTHPERPGWVIDEEWWNQRLTIWRHNQRAEIRIAK
jgi:hypothetical protein